MEPIRGRPAIYQAGGLQAHHERHRRQGRPGFERELASGGEESATEPEAERGRGLQRKVPEVRKDPRDGEFHVDVLV